MQRAYKFLLRPTSKQADALAACLEDHRQLYNAALQERREAWNMRKTSVSYYTQAMQLPEIRSADPERQGRWSAGSQQQTLRRLQWAFDQFFARVKSGRKAGYPRFKGRGRFNLLEWPARKNGARWDSVPHPTITRVYLLGIGHVRVHQHRPVAGRILKIKVRRDGKHWYVALFCEDVPAQPLPATGAVVGIDMGIRHFLTTSDGTHLPNPRYGKTAADALAEAQRVLAEFPRTRRAEDRTRPHRAAGARVRHLSAKLQRQRRDYAHKAALGLVRDHDVVVHEALKIENMTKRPPVRVADDGTYEPNGGAVKGAMNRSILDAGWGGFLAILRGKAESAGRAVIEVNPRNTSRRCAECGHVAKENRKDEEFCCVACGHEAHADVNAAINILRAGLALQAAQAA